MARQAILERLGWKFVRIRGSVFYRDPERAMAPVFSRLSELGIEPSPPLDEAPRTTDLQARVVAHASALLREWGTAREEVMDICEPEQASPAPTEQPRVPARQPPSRPGQEPGKLIEFPFVAGRPEAKKNGHAEGWSAVDLGRGSAIPVQNAPEASSDVAVAAPEHPTSPPPVAAPRADGNRKERFSQMLAGILPTAKCPLCGAPVALRISGYGPYMPCTKRCGGKHSIEFEKVKEAVAAASIACSCGGTFGLKKGKTTFLGCDRYPACRTTIWWSDL
jgi:hypothetical protein